MEIKFSSVTIKNKQGDSLELSYEEAKELCEQLFNMFQPLVLNSSSDTTVKINGGYRGGSFSNESPFWDTDLKKWMW